MKSVNTNSICRHNSIDLFSVVWFVPYTWKVLLLLQKALKVLFLYILVKLYKCLFLAWWKVFQRPTQSTKQWKTLLPNVASILIGICSDFIDEWVKIGLPAKAKVIENGLGGHDIDEQCEACARESVNLSLVNLQSYPYVQKAISNRKLALRGGYYDFVHGVFELWELESHISPPIITPAP